MHDAFETATLENLSRTTKRGSLQHTARSVTSPISESFTARLNIETVLKKDPDAKITQMQEGRFKLRLTQKHLSFMIADILAGDNLDSQVVLSQDLQTFEPNPEIVKTSAVPLWVVQPMKNGSEVMIKRIWR